MIIFKTTEVKPLTGGMLWLAVARKPAARNRRKSKAHADAGKSGFDDFPGATCWGFDSPGAARTRTGPNEAPAHGFSGGTSLFGSVG